MAQEKKHKKLSQNLNYYYIKIAGYCPQISGYLKFLSYMPQSFELLCQNSHYVWKFQVMYLKMSCYYPKFLFKYKEIN